MFLADSGLTDAFGHKQLGGVAPVLAQMISSIGLKNHWAVSDYLQRSARHISSKTDLDQAYAVGKKAVEFALAGKNAVMPVIKRLSNKPYKWKIESASLSKVANVEKTLPKGYISKDGFKVSSKGIDYLAPLIQGEPPLEFKNGIPVVAKLKNVLVKKLT
jgi:6-phosphofructokinase